MFVIHLVFHEGAVPRSMIRSWTSMPVRHSAMFLELFGLVWTGEHFFLLPSGEPALGDKGFQLPESILSLDRNASATGKQGSLQIITNAGMSLAATARGGGRRLLPRT